MPNPLTPSQQAAFEEADRAFEQQDEHTRGGYGRAMFAAGAANGAAQRQRQDAEICRSIASRHTRGPYFQCAERIEQEPTKP